jgi:carboxyl-terminal processing protease
VPCAGTGARAAGGLRPAHRGARGGRPRAYIRSEGASLAAASLRRAATGGRYASFCADDRAFAKTVTRDLRRGAGDGHVTFEYAPGASPSGDDAGWIDAWMKRGPSVGWGVAEAKTLEGGVGYIKLTSFYPLEFASPPLGRALREIAGIWRQFPV